jgi:hypothetical protein
MRVIILGVPFEIAEKGVVSTCDYHDTQVDSIPPLDSPSNTHCTHEVEIPLRGAMPSLSGKSKAFSGVLSEGAQC